MANTNTDCVIVKIGVTSDSEMSRDSIFSFLEKHCNLNRSKSSKTPRDNYDLVSYKQKNGVIYQIWYRQPSQKSFNLTFPELDCHIIAYDYSRSDSLAYKSFENWYESINTNPNCAHTFVAVNNMDDTQSDALTATSISKMNATDAQIRNNIVALTDSQYNHTQVVPKITSTKLINGAEMGSVITQVIDNIGIEKLNNAKQTTPIHTTQQTINFPELIAFVNNNHNQSRTQEMRQFWNRINKLMKIVKKNQQQPYSNANLNQTNAIIQILTTISNYKGIFNSTTGNLISSPDNFEFVRTGINEIRDAIKKAKPVTRKGSSLWVVLDLLLILPIFAAFKNLRDYGVFGYFAFKGKPGVIARDAKDELKAAFNKLGK